MTTGDVATGFKGLKAIVDPSGSLPMEIANEVVFLHKLTIPSGEPTPSGTEALAYVRERKSLANGDLGRSAHQGEMLLAAAVPARLAGVGVIPMEMSVVSRNAVTDLSAAEVLTFVASSHRLDL